MSDIKQTPFYDPKLAEAITKTGQDILRRVLREPCEYCGPGKYTGLPGNACENCMNTGLKYPTMDDLK